MGKKSNTDVELYDVLLDKFQKITSKMKHISPGDEEIGQKLIREQAKKVQAQIVAYLKNRTKHGLELTDEMIAFKGLETKLKELHFETVIKPQLRIADSNRRAMDGDFIPPPSQEPKLKPEDIAKTKEKLKAKGKESEVNPLGDYTLFKSFEFTRKQAQAIKYMYEQQAKGKYSIFKIDILKAAKSDSTILRDLFKSKGKLHPAWGTLIQRTQNSYYRLDI